MFSEVKRTERGWRGHFCGDTNCMFVRNTQLEYNYVKIVVSTIGRWLSESNGVERIGVDVYYETIAFFDAKNKQESEGIMKGIANRIMINSKCEIGTYNLDTDNEANDMHENVVKEIEQRLLSGNIKE